MAASMLLPGRTIAKSRIVVVPPKRDARLTWLRGSGLLAGHSHDGGGNVGVGFDASRDDHLAQGIEHLAYLCVQRPLLGYCHNLAALNADVPSADAPRRYDHATSNHHVNHGASSCCLGLTQANIPHRRLLPTPAVLLAAFR